MNFCERCRKEPIPWKSNLLRNHCQTTSCPFSQCQRIKYQSATPGFLASVARWFSSYSIISKHPPESKLWVAAIQNKLLIAHSFSNYSTKTATFISYFLHENFYWCMWKDTKYFSFDKYSFINCKDDLFQINIFDSFQAQYRFLIYIISFGSLLGETPFKR